MPRMMKVHVRLPLERHLKMRRSMSTNWGKQRCAHRRKETMMGKRRPVHRAERHHDAAGETAGSHDRQGKATRSGDRLGLRRNAAEEPKPDRSQT